MTWEARRVVEFVLLLVSFAVVGVLFLGVL